MSGIQMALMGSGSLTPTINLTSRSVEYTSGGVLSATAGWRADADSYVYTAGYSVTPAYTQQEQWDNVPSSVGDYEIYVSKVTGTGTPSGTLNTWLNLGTTRTWLLSATAGNYSQCIINAQIRDVATQTVRASANITLTADAT